MIKIAIIDDTPEDLSMLKEQFLNIQPVIMEEINVISFSSGEAFLSQYDYTVDLVCLDVDLGKGFDGFETAKRIREKDDRVLLVFVTFMAQMAVRGYEFQAIDYIIKPINPYSFALKMKSILQLALHRKTQNIVITTANGMVKLSTDDLYYVETDGHYLCYHTREGNYRHKGSMHDLTVKLSGLSFYLCNQSFLVNLRFVSEIKKDDVKVGSEWLKISRPRKKEFLSALSNYLGGDF